MSGLATAVVFWPGVVQERTRTRDLDELGGLMGPMPLYGGLVALAAFASLGLPGLAQFPAELQIFLATFDVWPAVAAVVAFGIAVTAALFLLALQRAFLGETSLRWRGLRDLDGRERLALVPLAVLIIALGVYPRLALDLIDARAWLGA